MTITPPGIDTCRLRGELHRTTVKTSNSQAVTKDRDSDGFTTYAVALLFTIYACKLLKTLYLFTPPDPVILNCNVSVTQKTRHSSKVASQDRNLLNTDSHIRKVVLVQFDYAEGVG